MDQKIMKSIDDIIREKSMAEIIAERDNMILLMNQELVKANTQIKEKDETIKNLMADKEVPKNG